MKITITDDFDLNKIASSGQCFRPKEVEPSIFCFITGKDVLFIRHIKGDSYDISCDMDSWNNVWREYFDLDTDYKRARLAVPKDDRFLTQASINGAGIRILNQDKFEMLISFIISQRKSIPAIRTSIEKLCTFYGEPIDTPYGNMYLFPSAKDIMAKGFDNLSNCSLGYRTDYIRAACEEVASGAFDLEKIGEYDDDKLLESLMSLKGVGIKVASCVALFAYKRYRIAPVDTWIIRVINDYYGGINPFPDFGEYSGIYQQYAFYNMIS